MKSISATLRQLRVPAPLRIAGPSDSEEAQIDRLIERLEQVLRPPEDPAQPDGETVDVGFVKEIATALWGLGRQADRLENSGPGRSVRRRMDLMNKMLERHEIEILDYTGKAYDSNLEGLVFEEVYGTPESFNNPMVVGMNEPRIRFRGAVIQRGKPQVDDGVDESEGEDK